MSEVWEHYVELITDPAHTLVEVTFIALEFILLSVLWAKVIKPGWERMLDAWHHRLDREHGHVHPGGSDGDQSNADEGPAR